ncbi:hypothetical protein B0H16DRAFT_1881963 [Mycena metata]|uniref:Uncharacterized protein n=1 Tax=Mycena metata TaxID=1033252 RepID=A0AAD7JQP5_9AGAR|nr:hypothetical protein B0H16DRAFT_1881963 [Mycena metata]
MANVSALLLCRGLQLSLNFGAVLLSKERPGPASSSSELVQRCQGLTKFHVLFAARSSGPIMIYGAFVLFFIGLVFLLFLSIYMTLAITAIAFLSLFLLGHPLTSVVMCFRPDTPYKTPMGNFLAACFHGMRLGKGPSYELTARIERQDVERQ